MAVPEIMSVTPTRGTTLGGELLRVEVRNLAPHAVLKIGSRIVEPQAREVRSDGAVLWVALPPRLSEGAVLVVQNLTPAGAAVLGEQDEWDGLLLQRADLTGEGLLVRLSRALLRALKAYAAPTARISVAIDFDADAGDGVRMVPVADTPALTVSGPRLELNRLYAPDQPLRETLVTPEGLRTVERTAAMTVDLVYDVTGTSRAAIELLNLMAGLSTFLSRTRWLELVRDPDDPGSELVRWELDVDGPFQSQLGGRDGVQVFTTRLRVRGVTTDWSAARGPVGGEGQLAFDLGVDGGRSER